MLSHCLFPSFIRVSNRFSRFRFSKHGWGTCSGCTCSTHYIQQAQMLIWNNNSFSTLLKKKIFILHTVSVCPIHLTYLQNIFVCVYEELQSACWTTTPSGALVILQRCSSHLRLHFSHTWAFPLWSLCCPDEGVVTKSSAPYLITDFTCTDPSVHRHIA